MPLVSLVSLVSFMSPRCARPLPGRAGAVVDHEEGRDHDGHAHEDRYQQVPVLAQGVAREGTQ
ncbi:hypothetical protein GCM10018952_53450 [Streptosporangium vulgare]